MLIIAEIGVNHNGDPDRAEKLIRAAKAAGANAVKFQHFSADKLALANTPKVKYQFSTTSKSETHQQMLQKLQITDEIEAVALNTCAEIGIEFLSTPYDPASVDHLLALNCRYIKTASADIVDHRIHERIASSDANAIVAVGMATLDEIDDVVEIYRRNNKSPILLHCVSSYPCSHESLNMRVISLLQERYELQIGFSDHSIDHRAATIAYTMGCRVFEKHFTLDKFDVGPDHKASSTPDEFAILVKELELTEKILGNKVKSLQEEERAMHQISRKSIHTIQPIKKGDLFTEDNITMIRPGINGLNGSKYYEIIGKTAKEDILQNVQIKVGHFE